MQVVMAVIPVVAVAFLGVLFWTIAYVSRQRGKAAAAEIDRDLHESIRKLKKLDETFVEQVLSGMDVDAALGELAKGRVGHFTTATDTPWLFEMEDIKKKADVEKSQQLIAVHGHGRLMALAVGTTVLVLTLVAEAVLYSQMSPKTAPIPTPASVKKLPQIQP